MPISVGDFVESITFFDNAKQFVVVGETGAQLFNFHLADKIDAENTVELVDSLYPLNGRAGGCLQYAEEGRVTIVRSQAQADVTHAAEDDATLAS